MADSEGSGFDRLDDEEEEEESEELCVKNRGRPVKGSNRCVDAGPAGNAVTD